MNSVAQKFESIGARVVLRERFIDPRIQALSPLRRRLGGVTPRPIVVDIKKDRLGEYFDIEATKDTELQIIDFNKGDRHLLLAALNGKGRDKSAPKYLLGHDERHWFAAAIPKDSVTSITAAKQALKPVALVNLERGQVATKNLHKRHRKLKSGGKIHRQGEFMFYPEPDFKPYDDAVLKNEPMRRGAIGRANPRQPVGGKPHMAEYLYRSGGVTVYVNALNPNGITQGQYNMLIRKNPQEKLAGWQVMQRDATAYVKGRIRHSDHKTLDLGDVWHRVFVNTESDARHSTTVAFLD